MLIYVKPPLYFSPIFRLRLQICSDLAGKYREGRSTGAGGALLLPSGPIPER